LLLESIKHISSRHSVPDLAHEPYDAPLDSSWWLQRGHTSLLPIHSMLSASRSRRLRRLGLADFGVSSVPRSHQILATFSY